MADAVIRRINKETAACMMPVIKSYAKENGLWDDQTRGPAYDKKNQQLQERWK